MKKNKPLIWRYYGKPDKMDVNKLYHNMLKVITEEKHKLTDGKRELSDDEFYSILKKAMPKRLNFDDFMKQQIAKEVGK